jgi:hypothetical protein
MTSTSTITLTGMEIRDLVEKHIAKTIPPGRKLRVIRAAPPWDSEGGVIKIDDFRIPLIVEWEPVAEPGV